MARFPIIPQWTETVSRLLAEGAEVEAHCDGCARTHRPDLAKLQARFGPLYSLWNRRPPCPVPKCRGRLTFAARRPDSGAWRTLLKTEDPAATDPLHRIWRADRAAGRAEADELVWLRKRRRRRAETRQAARDLVQRLGPAALDAAERALHMPGMSDYQLAIEVDVYRAVRRRVAALEAAAAAAEDAQADRA